jgi:hypothetical protein
MERTIPLAKESPINDPSVHTLQNAPSGCRRKEDPQAEVAAVAKAQWPSNVFGKLYRKTIRQALPTAFPVEDLLVVKYYDESSKAWGHGPYPVNE